MKLHVKSPEQGKPTEQLHDIEISLSFAGEQETEIPPLNRFITGGKVKFGLRRCQLKLQLDDNCHVPLESIAMGQPFEDSITSSREFSKQARIEMGTKGIG